MILRLVLVLVVFGLLALGVLMLICKSYYDEWVLLKSKEMLKEEMCRNKIAKDSMRRKKRSSNDSGGDKLSSKVSHDSQASSDDDSNARKRRDKRKRIKKIDLNASDVDNVENERSGILKQSTSTNMAQKSATAKVNSSTQVQALMRRHQATISFS